MTQEIIELKKYKGSELGLYDSRSPKQKSVKAKKVIDITSYCEDVKQVVVKYADVTRGRIAQLCNWYQKDEDLGSTLHYHINEMTPEQLARDSVFATHSRVLGIPAIILSRLIYANQPKPLNT